MPSTSVSSVCEILTSMGIEIPEHIVMQLFESMNGDADAVVDYCLSSDIEELKSRFMSKPVPKATPEKKTKAIKAAAFFDTEPKPPAPAPTKPAVASAWSKGASAVKTPVKPAPSTSSTSSSSLSATPLGSTPSYHDYQYRTEKLSVCAEAHRCLSALDENVDTDTLHMLFDNLSMLSSSAPITSTQASSYIRVGGATKCVTVDELVDAYLLANGVEPGHILDTDNQHETSKDSGKVVDWHFLPFSILVPILEMLSPVDLLSLRQASQQWMSVCDEHTATRTRLAMGKLKNFEPSILRRVVTLYPKLHHFSLSNARAKHTEIVRMVQVLPSTLTSINLSGLSLRNVEWHAIVEYLSLNCPNLAELHAAEAGVTDEVCQYINEKLPRLQSLTLSNNPLTDIGMATLLSRPAMQSLVAQRLSVQPATYSRTTLKHLDVSHNAFTHLHIASASLLTLIAHHTACVQIGLLCPSLQTLNVSHAPLVSLYLFTPQCRTITAEHCYALTSLQPVSSMVPMKLPSAYQPTRSRNAHRNGNVNGNSNANANGNAATGSSSPRSERMAGDATADAASPSPRSQRANSGASTDADASLPSSLPLDPVAYSNEDLSALLSATISRLMPNRALWAAGSRAGLNQRSWLARQIWLVRARTDEQTEANVAVVRRARGPRNPRRQVQLTDDDLIDYIDEEIDEEALFDRRVVDTTTPVTGTPGGTTSGSTQIRTGNWQVRPFFPSGLSVGGVMLHATAHHYAEDWVARTAKLDSLELTRVDAAFDDNRGSSGNVKLHVSFPAAVVDAMVSVLAVSRTPWACERLLLTHSNRLHGKDLASLLRRMPLLTHLRTEGIVSTAMRRDATLGMRNLNEIPNEHDALRDVLHAVRECQSMETCIIGKVTLDKLPNSQATQNLHHAHLTMTAANNNANNAGGSAVANSRQSNQGATQGLLPLSELRVAAPNSEISPLYPSTQIPVFVASNRNAAANIHLYNAIQDTCRHNRMLREAFGGSITDQTTEEPRLAPGTPFTPGILGFASGNATPAVFPTSTPFPMESSEVVTMPRLRFVHNFLAIGDRLNVATPQAPANASDKLSSIAQSAEAPTSELAPGADAKGNSVGSGVSSTNEAPALADSALDATHQDGAAEHDDSRHGDAEYDDTPHESSALAADDPDESGYVAWLQALAEIDAVHSHVPAWQSQWDDQEIDPSGKNVGDSGVSNRQEAATDAQVKSHGR